ncbi:MAG: SRPBCC domain-containing protein [Bryobacteraceae bacterium]
MSDTLELSIHVNAKPETVFRFLSDPELFKQWMGPGALLHTTGVTVHYPTGEIARGTLRESVPNERIVFGWGYDENTHGLAPDSTTVTIQLTATPTGTTVTLMHAGIDETRQAEHAKGWTYYLGQLGSAAANHGFAAALPAAVENYIKAWKETDLTARAAQLDACWEESAAFRDSMGVAEGRTALLHYISNAQKFVPGFQLELAGPPEQCHGYYRFPWLIRTPDGNVMSRGTNFGQLSSSGRFASAVGFWDKT